MQSTEELALAPELAEQETLLWSSRPQRASLGATPQQGAASVVALTLVGVFMLFLLVIFIPIIIQLAQLLSQAAPGDLLTNISFIGILVFLVILFLLLPVLLVVLALQNGRTSKRNTIYGITNQRVIILRTGRTRTVQSHSKEALSQMTRVERSDGSGNLMWYRYPSTTTIPAGALLNVPNVREAERLLRQLM